MFIRATLFFKVWKNEVSKSMYFCEIGRNDALNITVFCTSKQYSLCAPTFLSCADSHTIQYCKVVNLRQCFSTQTIALFGGTMCGVAESYP